MHKSSTQPTCHQGKCVKPTTQTTSENHDQLKLRLGEAPLVEAFPVVPMMGNVPLGIGALSYAGQFNLTVVADRDACPDVQVFVDEARSSLDELARSMTP